jgi:predicted NBD/HSP70 family sugar kinase
VTTRASLSPAAREARLRLRPRGSNQVGLGQYNDRVVLQAIRLFGPLPSAEIARLTHLSAQTVSLIIARLEGEHLVVRGEPVRGRVGQPSVPIALDPDGAFAIGIKIGRRSMDTLLIDFTGRVRERLTLKYRFPDADTLFDQIATRVQALRKVLGSRRDNRLQGIGIAAPLSLGGWQSLLGVPARQAAKWDGVDIGARVAAACGDLPVQLTKDTAAACVAELVGGRGREIGNFLYVFVDTFIGGALVLAGRPHFGRTGNGGAIGSLLLREGGARAGAPPPQVLSVASLFQLEARYLAAGLDGDAIADDRALEAPWRAHTQKWLRRATPAIALVVHDAACLLDLDGVIVDGSFSRGLLDQLLKAVQGELDRTNLEGVARPALVAGTIGSDARAIGGALLPLYANFAPARDLFQRFDG